MQKRQSAHHFGDGLKPDIKCGAPIGRQVRMAKL